MILINIIVYCLHSVQYEVSSPVVNDEACLSIDILKFSIPVLKIFFHYKLIAYLKTTTHKHSINAFSFRAAATKKLGSPTPRS